MATNDIKLLKLDAGGVWQEFNLTAVANQIIGFDGTVNPVMVGAASTTASGIIEIATGAEVDTGTDDVRAISPKALADQTVLLKKTGGALSGALNEAKGADIASATTTDIGAATGNYVVVTGTTTITGLGTVQAGTRRVVKFSGILTLTHNATSLILPTGANITTAADDTATFISLGSGNWVCTSYQRKDGTALAAAGGGATILRVVKTADESVNNSATYQDDNHLTLTVVANTTYIVELFLPIVQSALDAYFKAQFVAPVGATIVGASKNQRLVGGSTDELAGYSAYSIDMEFRGYTYIMAPGTASGEGQIKYQGVLFVSSTGGTFKLQWAQYAAVANNTTVKKGAYLKLIEV